MSVGSRSINSTGIISRETIPDPVNSCLSCLVSHLPVLHWQQNTSSDSNTGRRILPAICTSTIPVNTLSLSLHSLHSTLVLSLSQGPLLPQSLPLSNFNAMMRQASLSRVTKQLMPTPRGRRPPSYSEGGLVSLLAEHQRLIHSSTHLHRLCPHCLLLDDSEDKRHSTLPTASRAAPTNISPQGVYGHLQVKITSHDEQPVLALVHKEGARVGMVLLESRLDRPVYKGLKWKYSKSVKLRSSRR